MQTHHHTRIHPTAEVSSAAIVGEGTTVWHYVQVRERASIGRNCILGKGVYVDFDVTIGDNCKLQNSVFVYHPAIVGDGVFLGPGVIITNDKMPRAVNPDSTLKSGNDWVAAPVLIETGAAVGAGVVILPGVTVGEWAMIGAGAVVTKDVPAYGLVVGNPARLVGHVCTCGVRLARVGANEYRCPACQRELEIEEVSNDTCIATQYQ